MENNHETKKAEDVVVKKEKGLVDLRTANTGDWKRFVDCAVREQHWALSYDDHEVVCDSFSADCLLLIEHQRTGKILAMFLFAPYIGENLELLFCGAFLTRAPMREADLASQLFQEAKKRLNASVSGRNTCLHGNHIVLKEYGASWGLTVLPKWTVAYTTVHGASMKRIRKTGWKGNIALVNMSMISIERLTNYDCQVTGGVQRQAWLKSWLRHPSGHSKIALDDQGEVCGYGMARETEIGRPKSITVGPLYANDINVAKGLLFAVLNSFAGIERRSLIMYPIGGDGRMHTLITEELEGKPIILAELTPSFSTSVIPCNLDKVFLTADPPFSFI